MEPSHDLSSPPRQGARPSLERMSAVCCRMLQSVVQNGSAAFHSGEPEVACTSIFLFCVTRQTPPWMTALPEAEVITGV